VGCGVDPLTAASKKKHGHTRESRTIFAVNSFDRFMIIVELYQISSKFCNCRRGRSPEQAFDDGRRFQILVKKAIFWISVCSGP
jgi:hypothetical protein